MSVITVAYNAVESLHKTMLSIIGHPRDEVEYLVIDGGSTDGTRMLLNALNSQIDYWVSERDGGIYDAMNKGIEAARGDWLIFINAGDILLPGALRALLHEFEASSEEAEVISGRVEIIDHNGQALGYTHPATIGSVEKLPEGNCIAHQATLIRRRVFERYGLYSTRYRIMGDYEYWVRLARSGVKMLFTTTAVAGFATGGISSLRSSHLCAKREQLTVLVQYGYHHHIEAALRYYASAATYYVKGVVRLCLGSRLSQKISLARLRNT